MPYVGYLTGTAPVDYENEQNQEFSLISEKFNANQSIKEFRYSANCKVFLQKCGPFSLSAGGGGCPGVLLQHSIPLSAHSTFVTLTSFPHTARMFTGNKECSTSPQSSSLQFWLYLASTDRAYILSSLFMLEPFIH